MNASFLLLKVKENWKSGLTVALVSLPLSVSLAIASGASPNAGIITAIWAGLVASLLGGSHFNIVGPAGALSGILAVFALTNGAGALPTLAVTSAALIFVAWLVKAERFLVFVPASTMHGFTLGVGIIIGLGQLGAALGITPHEKHAEFLANSVQIIKQVPETSLPTLIVFGLSLVFLFGMLRISKKIPGAILLAPLGIAYGWLAGNGTVPGGGEVLTLAEKFGDFSTAIIQPFTLQFGGGIISASIAVALVAILETMLTAKIADGITKTKHNSRKELLALAVANVASGVTGGLPATGVLVRTSLNAKSGATHKTSGVINAIALAVVSLLLLRYFAYIPMAVIAAILVFASIRMVEVTEFAHMWKVNRTSFCLSLAVAVATVVWDPIVGILFGVAAASLVMMERMSRAQCEVWAKEASGKVVACTEKDIDTVAQGTEAETLTYAIRGELVYLNGEAHVARFEAGLTGFDTVVLNLKGLHFMDDDGAASLERIMQLCKEAGCKVLVSGASRSIVKMLDLAVPSFVSIREDGLAVDSVGEALSLV